MLVQTKFSGIFISFLLIVFLLFGCSSIRPVANEEFFLLDAYSHTVRFKGETLATISGWYTGDTKNWNKLAECNKLQDPNKIEIGQKIFIPNTMLKRFSDLPKEMIIKSSPKILVSKPQTKQMAPVVKITESKPLDQNPEVDNYKRASLKISKPIKNALNLEQSLKKIEQEKSLNSLNKK